MAADHETERAESDEAEAPPKRAQPKRLPARVERALAAARDAAKADRERKSGRWLAVFPVAVGVIALGLLMPRAAVPDSPPLPLVNGRALRAVERADDERAVAAEGQRLPSYVLAVGSALRELNGLDVRGGDGAQKADARRRLTVAVAELPNAPGVEGELLSLRALQTHRFIDAVAAWESTGQSSEDSIELGGNFVATLQEASWAVGHHVLLDDSQRRAAFKVVWNAVVGVDRRPAFVPTLDENRVLYTFYIEHPHVSEANRMSLALDRESAKTPEACDRVLKNERRQSAAWLIDKVKKLGSLDPTYPTEYALGITYFSAGRFDQSAEAFATYIKAHPDGPYGLRARNHLKAAVAANLAY